MTDPDALTIFAITVWLGLVWFGVEFYDSWESMWEEDDEQA